MGVTSKSFDSPDESRTFENGEGGLVNLGSTVVGRMKVQPGWSWSKAIKPKAGTDSCELQHTGFLVGGRLTVKCDDGTQTTIEAGSAYVIEPGHDAWVEGDEPVEMIEFNSKSAQTMAKTLE